MDVENLSLGTLELLLLPHVVPELRLGDNRVLGEDSEGQDSGVGLSLGGVPPAEDEVLPDLCEWGNTFIWRLESAGSCAAFFVILTMKLFIKIFQLFTLLELISSSLNSSFIIYPSPSPLSLPSPPPPLPPSLHLNPHPLPLEHNPPILASILESLVQFPLFQHILVIEPEVR